MGVQGQVFEPESGGVAALRREHLDALPKPMRADPKAGDEQSDGADQSSRAPPNQLRMTVRAMNLCHHLAGFQPSALDVLL